MKKLLLIIMMLFVSNCAKKYDYNRRPKAMNPRVFKPSETTSLRDYKYKAEKYNQKNKDEFKYQGETLGKIDISKIEEKQEKLESQRYITNPNSVEKKLNISVLLPLTGKAQKVGQELKNSIEMAYYDISNPNIKLSFYNTEGDSDIAAKKAVMAINEGADIFLGPLFSDSVKSVSEVAKSEDIKVLSFTTDTSVLKDNTYSVNYLKSQEMERVITYAAYKNMNDLVFLLPENSLGTILKSTIDAKTAEFNIDKKIVMYDGSDSKDLSVKTKEVSDFTKREADLKSLKRIILNKVNSCKEMGYVHSSIGGVSVLNQALTTSCNKYNELSTALDKKTSLGKIKEDGIFIAGNTSSVVSIGAFLAYYDINNSETQILGLSNFADRKVRNENFYTGSVYTAQESDIDSAFSLKYNSYFGKEPVSISQTAYDAIYLISISEDNGYLNKDVLLSSSGFYGASGLFRLRNDGEVERGISIKKISSGRSTKEEVKSPKSFKKYYDEFYTQLAINENGGEQTYEDMMENSNYFSTPRTMKEIENNLTLLNVKDLNKLEILD